MLNRVVIVHPEYGVFVDQVENKAIFSTGDTMKMTSVVVFDSNEEAAQVVSQFLNVPINTFAFMNIPNRYEDSDALTLMAAGVPAALLGGLIDAELLSLKRMRRRGFKLN